MVGAPHQMFEVVKVNAFFLTSHHVTPFKEKKSKTAANSQGREKDDKLRRVLEEILIKIPSKIEVQCS